MSTFGTMLDRIQSELLRTDLAATASGPIAAAVQSAIRHYERERFYFNESRSIEFSLSSSQEFYGLSDHAAIPQLLDIDAVTLTYGGSRYQVRRQAYDDLEARSIGIEYTSIPTAYAYYGQQMRFYPIPSQGLPVRVSALVRLETLSATTDSNAWMTEAEELIRARAKWDLCLNVVKDYEEAQAQASLEARALAALRGDTQQRLGTGRLRPTCF